MITEGIVALVWATVASYFFYDNGYEVFHSSLKASAPQVVNVAANEWLGSFGAVLALLGVVAAPITSGDTALRSARLIIAEFVHLAQRTIKSRLLICIPLFTATMALLWYNITDADGFNIIWGYFGWANQTLAIFTLWTLTVYFVRNGKPFILVLLPALFMTAVCPAFLVWKIVHIDVVKSALGDGSFFLSDGFGSMVGLLSVIIALACFLLWYRNRSSYGTKI
jgi:carbon starvation protein CstA